MPRKRAWVQYVEQKYRTVLPCREVNLCVGALAATQPEIERIKYDLVRYEAFRIDQPILACRAGRGPCYVIDGHTRVRVLADTGRTAVAALLYTADDAGLQAELRAMAVEAGGGRPRPVVDVPIVDRLGGPGSKAWEERRRELLAKWRREDRARHESDGA